MAAPRILILDDNFELAENVRDILLTADDLQGVSEVVIAPDAKTGLAIVARGHFDVAIVDVRLPDAFGVDLVAPLKEAMPHGEVVLLTGNATVESAVRAVRAGAFGLILKGFRPEELMATVRQALAQVALRRERAKFERRSNALMNAGELLIAGLDLAGAVVFLNPTLTSFLGVADTSVLGRPFAETFIDASDRRRFEAAFKAALSSEDESASPTTFVEVGMRTDVGSVRRVLFHMIGVGEDDASRDDHVYAVGVDVTQRTALERRAANAEALNAIAPLALGLAHEIRNPLNAALLQLHLLGRAAEKVPDPEQGQPMRARVDVVAGELRRLERLVTEFLELTRPRPPQRERVDLSDVVRQVLDLEAQVVEEQEVELHAHLAPRALVVGDVEKLKQVVLNLVVNALDAMENGGELRATVESRGASVCLSLSDTGGGIEESNLADVFDPFFTTKPAGTGLGLAIVRKLVELHGGTVELSSSPGRGTEVVLTFPKAPDPEP
jgi:PAS domain S-box-containing protein